MQKCFRLPTEPWIQGPLAQHDFALILPCSGSGGAKSGMGLRPKQILAPQKITTQSALKPKTVFVGRRARCNMIRS